MFLVSVFGSETLLLRIFSHTTLGAQMLIGAQRYLEFHDKWVSGEPGFIISRVDPVQPDYDLVLGGLC